MELQSGEMLDDVAMELGQIYRSSAVVSDAEDDGFAKAKKPEEWAGQPGTRAPHVKLAEGATGKELSSLDLFNHGGWTVLSADNRWGGAVKAAKQRFAQMGGMLNVEFVQIGGHEIVEVEKGSFEKAYGMSYSGAVLVRPDGIVAWRSRELLEDVDEALTSVLGTVGYARKA